MSDDKLSITGNIRVKTYTVLERAIEEGVEFGYNRAFKYTDHPTRETFLKEITNAIMLNIDEVFSFPELEDGGHDD